MERRHDESQKKSLKRHLERTEGSKGNAEDVNSMMFIAGELKPMKARISNLENQVQGLLAVYKDVAPKKEIKKTSSENPASAAEIEQAWDE